jgi:16S rRNA (adenine1518-N6/adenine1519-N6)-dimethyltransferase
MVSYIMDEKQTEYHNWQALIRKHGIRPSKRLGQHFMLARGSLEKVVKAADLDAGDTVLEIGAGIGALTILLAESARRVVAVEIDIRLLPALQEAVAGHANIEIVRGDILEQDIGSLMGADKFNVVANIPYNITSMLIRRLLEAPKQPDRLILTVQREVAQRIVAQPGQMSLLALSVRLYGDASIKARIPAGSFFPPPNVESAILRIDLRDEMILPGGLVPEFFRLARAGFHQKRKQLRNSLASGLNAPPQQVVSWLENAGISPRSRAQELSIDDWIRLVTVASKVDV